MADKIGVGFIGLGNWGRRFVKEYEQNQNDSYRLVAVSDQDPQALAALQTSDAITKTTNINDIAQDKRIEAVHIATPNHTHFELAKQMLEAGKHVLVEKPLCGNARAAFLLNEIAKRHERVLKVGHIYRFNASVDALKSIIQSNTLGRIRFVRYHWSAPMQSFPENTNVLSDLAPHLFDILNYLFDDWPVRINCVLGSALQLPKQDDIANLLLNFEDGRAAEAHLYWWSVAGEKKREIEVLGEHKSAILRPVEQKLCIIDHNYNKEDVQITSNNTMADEIFDFIAAINNSGHRNNSGAIGASIVALIDAAEISHRLGRAIDLKIERSTNGTRFIVMV